MKRRTTLSHLHFLGIIIVQINWAIPPLSSFAQQGKHSIVNHKKLKEDLEQILYDLENNHFFKNNLDPHFNNNV